MAGVYFLAFSRTLAGAEPESSLTAKVADLQTLVSPDHGVSAECGRCARWRRRARE